MSPFHARRASRRPRGVRGSPHRAAPRAGPVLTDPGVSRPRRPGGGPALTSRRAAARRRCRAPGGRRRGRERPAGTAARCPAGPARRPGPPTSRCAGARTARSRTRPAAPPPRPPPSSACRRRARAAATDTGARPSASPALPITAAANRAAARAPRGRCLGRPRPSSPQPGRRRLTVPPTRPGGAGGGRASHRPATARKGRARNTPLPLFHRPPQAVRSWDETAPFVTSLRPSHRPQFWRSPQPPDEAKTRSRCSPVHPSPALTAAAAHGGEAVAHGGSSGPLPRPVTLEHAQCGAPAFPPVRRARAREEGARARPPHPLSAP